MSKINKPNVEIITDEKTYRNLIKQSLKKKMDDFAFDDNFNEALKEKIFTSKSNTWEFWAGEESLYELYLYYHYSKRYFNYYSDIAIKTLNIDLQKNIKDIEKLSMNPDLDVFLDEAALMQYYDDKKIIVEEIKQTNLISMIFMLYSCYEKFLHRIIKLIEDTDSVLSPLDDDNRPVAYMNYLANTANIFVPHKLYNEFEMFRLIRNTLIHKDSTTSFKLGKNLFSKLKQFKRLYMYKNGYIYLDDTYIESLFLLITKLMNCIENEYIKYIKQNS